MSPARADRLRAAMDERRASLDVAARLAADPVQFPRRYARRDDAEVAGLVAACLAFGNVATIRAKVGALLARVGPHPADYARTRTLASMERDLSGWRHRVYRGEDVARLLFGAGALLRAHGSIGAAFRARFDAAGGGVRAAMAAFVRDLRDASPPPRKRSSHDGRRTRRGEAGAPTRGLAHLLADPLAGSACKRLCLYLRWMVRPDDGVDLGLWDVPASALVVPLDTHVHRIARNLGLTRRRTADWVTALDVTRSLARLDPADPVKYDFAIAHMGIARDCPSRRVRRICSRCAMRGVCIRWREPAVARARGL